MTIETNIRIVAPGESLYIWARKARVEGTDLSPDLLQRACGSLRHRHRLAAIPSPYESATLLIGTKYPVEELRLEEAEWALTICDAGESAQKLTLATPEGVSIMPQLLERALQVTLARRSDYWRLGDSAYIWYEEKPFLTQGGITAHHRYEVGSILIDGEGVGIIVDVGTAFFSMQSLAYYFDFDVSTGVKQQLQTEFELLTARQMRHKGTLLYDNGRYRMKCYFEDAPSGVTCSTTDEIRINGTSYPSLAHYYREAFPELQFDENGRAVRVTFPRRKKPVWVAAELVRVRIMNDALPGKLRRVDKLDPAKRRNLLQNFWQDLGQRPFHWVAPGLRNGFWQPSEDRVLSFSLADLTFGKGERFKAPTERTPDSYRQNYRDRMEFLDEVGCYDSPAIMPRELHIAYPSQLSHDTVDQLATEIAQSLAAWTKRPLQATEPLPYQEVSQACARLEEDDASVVLFILNDEPTAYHDAVFEKPWRIKRITQSAFEEHVRYLEQGEWSRKQQGYSKRLGRKRWRSFVEKNALGILPLLDAVPFRIDQAGPYEAQLAIDVGHDQRHFALVLQIAREESKTPSFRIRSNFQIKPDHQHAEINRRMLIDELIKLFDTTFDYRFDPLDSLLVLRDGQFWKREIEAVQEAVKILKEKGFITPSARTDLVDLRKNPGKAIRFWETDEYSGDITNPLEGTGVLINANTTLLATTGSATLYQGTARPITISGDGDAGENVVDATRAVWEGAQLNWASPKVAQRLPSTIKSADEELRTRDAQEIRRLK